MNNNTANVIMLLVVIAGLTLFGIFGQNPVSTRVIYQCESTCSDAGVKEVTSEKCVCK